MNLSDMARAMGRIGGKNRAKNLSKERQVEIARNAGLASVEARRKAKQEQLNSPLDKHSVK